MNKRITLILLFLSISIISFTQTTATQFTALQLQQGYNIFIQSLREAHPGLYRYTTEFASALHNRKKATFIGEETGGAYYGNNSGVFAIVTLPNTKLSVSIPLIGFYANVFGYPYQDRGILPDYEVKKTVNDVLQNRDTVMLYALQLVQSKQIQ